MHKIVSSFDLEFKRSASPTSVRGAEHCPPLLKPSQNAPFDGVPHLAERTQALLLGAYGLRGVGEGPVEAEADAGKDRALRLCLGTQDDQVPEVPLPQEVL